MPRTKQHDRQFILLDDGQHQLHADEIINELENGATITSVANRLDVSTSHLRQWLARTEVPRGETNDVGIDDAAKTVWEERLATPSPLP